MNGLVIADAGAIFSLAITDNLEFLNQIFTEVKIPEAVWKEITLDQKTNFYTSIQAFFKSKVIQIQKFNQLSPLMDYGESEAVILYQELNADFLLIDDKKARKIAENLGVKCVGTLGVLSSAKDKGLLKNLKPVFEKLLANNRYYSLNLLNSLGSSLELHNEEKII
jgi:hypothetical protein